MPRNELEVRRDVQRIDRMIDRMERQAEEHDSPQVTALFAKELPKLLERRAALLGHDAPKGSEQTELGSLAELERKLALVSRSS